MKNLDYNLSVEDQTKLSLDMISAFEDNNLNVLDMSVTFTGTLLLSLAKLRSEAVKSGDEDAYDKILDRLHSEIETFRISP